MLRDSLLVFIKGLSRAVPETNILIIFQEQYTCRKQFRIRKRPFASFSGHIPTPGTKIWDKIETGTRNLKVKSVSE